MRQLEASKVVQSEALEERSLLDELLDEAGMGGAVAGQSGARAAIEALCEALLLRGVGAQEEIGRVQLDVMLAEIDEKLSEQTNAILHNPEFQRLESAWRGLAFMVDSIDFAENTKVEVLSVSKGDLRRDLEDAPEATASGFYRAVYAREYGVFGGEPYGLIVADFEVGHDPEDISLLAQIASVAAMAHSVFIANAAPSFFGLESYTGLPDLGALAPLMDGPQFAAWRAFRQTEDARYIGLCLPRFLLRLPYRVETHRFRSLAFDEDVEGAHERYLWGSASSAFATRVAESFARYRWCPNIIGPSTGGAVGGQPIQAYDAMGGHVGKISTECLVTDVREAELSQLGFIPLVHRKQEEDACFFSASSCQAPRAFRDAGRSSAAAVGERVGAQLPYVFVIARLAHNIKVQQREMLGSAVTSQDMQKSLTTWIRRYVAEIDDPSPDVRSRTPLRNASIEVEEVAGEVGWYRCRISIQPHFRYMNASFTLSLIGKLDRGER